MPPATVKLQSKESDILAGYKMIKVLRNTVQHVRNNIDSKHDIWYGEALKLANTLQVNESMPRINRRQIFRANPSC